MNEKDLSTKQQALISIIKKNKPSSWTANHSFSDANLIIEIRYRSIIAYATGHLIATITYDETNSRLLLHFSDGDIETSKTYIRTFLKKFVIPFYEI